MSTGQIVGGVVGAAAGFLMGGNVFLGAQLGMMAGGMLDPPKTPTQEGPRVSDLTTQTSTYGAVIPRIYGTDAIAGNVIWLENNKIKETATKKKSSGKGGGSKTSTRTYTYSATFAVGLCKGPIVGIRRMWIGPDLVYDAGSSDTSTITASNQSAAGWTLYTGTNTQGADPRMQATLGVANTPAYRGLAYLVFEDFALAKYGNSLAGVQVRAEVMQSAAVYTYPYQTFTLPSNLQYRAATYDGTVYCAVASYSHIVVTSPDGLSPWTQYAIPNGNTAQYEGIASDGAGTLIVYGVANGFFRSTNHGASWSAITTPGFGGSTIHVVFNGTKWLASTDGGPFFVSTDSGATWVAKTSPNTGGNMGRTLVWHAASSKWYICANFLSDPIIYSSPSAESGTWSVAYTMTGDLNNFGQACVHSGRLLYIGLGTGGSGYGPMMVWSDDGVTWTKTSVPKRSYSIVSDNNDFVWVGTESSTSNCSYSPNGVDSWTSYVGPGQGVNHYLFAANGFIIAMPIGSNVGFRIKRTFSTPSLVQLSSIASAECLQSGILTSGDIDVTSLTPQVRGYSVGTVGTIRSALEPLQAAWPFDIRQHGYKVQFLLRPGTSVITIPSADLDARSGEPGVMITTQRVPDTQLPAKVLVRYKDYDREYNQGEQYASRTTVQSFNSQVLDIAVVLTSDEAAGKAETLLYLYWIERHEIAFTLPGTYNQLEAGDVVNLTTPEGILSLRLIGVNNTSDGRVECKAKYNSPSVYTPTAVGASPVVSGPTTITPVGISVYSLLDVPMISSAQSTPSFLAAMTGALSGWQGGTLMQSTDSGGTWASLQDFDPPGSVMGTCSNNIGVVDSRVVDNASVLSVTMTQGSLYSVTQASMFSGSNMFAYGADGRWEIISVQVCTLVSGSSYTLKDMLRGQYGTEWAMGLHVNGDALVLLDTIDTALIAMGSGMIGLSWLYRGITADQDISTGVNTSFTYRGVNLMPLSPISLTGSIDPGTFDWTLSFIPRTRENAAWKDSVDAPIGELSQSYQIDVFSSGAYTALKRTISSSSATAIAYSSADQVTDFGSNQSTLYLKVYQLSSMVGRGYPLIITITR